MVVATYRSGIAAATSDLERGGDRDDAGEVRGVSETSVGGDAENDTSGGGPDDGDRGDYLSSRASSQRDESLSDGEASSTAVSLGNPTEDENDLDNINTDDDDDKHSEHHDALSSLRDDDVELGQALSAIESENDFSSSNHVVRQAARHNRRESFTLDLDTGKIGGARGHMAELRHSDSRAAMDSAARRRLHSFWGHYQRQSFSNFGGQSSANNTGLHHRKRTRSEDVKDGSTLRHRRAVTMDQSNVLNELACFGASSASTVPAAQGSSQAAPVSATDTAAVALSATTPVQNNATKSSALQDQTGQTRKGRRLKVTSSSNVFGDVPLAPGGSSIHRDDDYEKLKPQYRLQAIQPTPPGNRILRFLGLSSMGAVSIYEDANDLVVGKQRCCCGLLPACNPNVTVMRYLHWSFRASFFEVFVSAAIMWFTMTFMFALGIWGIGSRRPKCIGGVDFANGTYFTDAWQLSWGTFATVGYGIIHPATSATEPNVRECVGMSILVAFEAFIGVLFGSMCGAIMHAKVARMQSFAQVSFSDPLVIRYGTGVAVEEDAAHDDNASDESSSQAFDENRCPCPVLEFRLMNRLNSTHGGEIIDATVNVVASIDASQASKAVRHAVSRRRKGKKGKKGGLKTQALQKRSSLRLGDRNLFRKLRRDNSSKGSELFSKELPANRVGKTHQAFEEDPTGHLVPRRIFSKLETESPDHPFFKRVWVVRHRLDQDSPLLRTHARQLVKRNHGHWPKELNSAEGVRSAIHFDQILVSLSGTSNADASSVYSQKVYDFADLNVGYRFVNSLYRDSTDGSLRVDMRLMNDVTEQTGGGGEPFLNVEEQRLQDMLVL